MINSIHIDLLGTETRFVKSRDYLTRVIEVHNDRPPLILLHGGGGHAETFSRNLNTLAEVCRPIAMDFIWHGMSSRPTFSNGAAGDDVHWLRQFTLQVLNLMEALGLESASFEGESLGGWVALDLAINFPEKVDAIVLNTAWGIALDKDWVKEGAADLEALRETSVAALKNPTLETLRTRLEWLMPLGGVTDELVSLRQALWSIPETREALLEYYERLFSPGIEDFYFHEPDIRTIQSPTLVLWTDKNPIHGVDAAERLHQLVEGSALHIMEGCAHWPQWERPEEHDAVVCQFLARAIH